MRGLTEFKTRADEMSAYFKVLVNWSDSPQIKFVIVAHYRTGSNLLTDLLNTHPEVNCDGEILIKFLHSRFKIVLFPRRYVEGKASHSGAKVYGCNLKLDQMAKLMPKVRKSPQILLSELLEDQWLFLHLQRQNVLRVAISNIIANKRGRWRENSANWLEGSKIYIDCDDLARGMRWNKKLLRQEEEVLAGVPHLKLIYEQDLLHTDQHQNTSDRVFDFLGISSVPVKTDLVRTSSNRMSDYVLNYEELVQTVGQTEFAQYLPQT